MKISELQAQLEYIKQEWGDMPIFFNDLRKECNTLLSVAGAIKLIIREDTLVQDRLNFEFIMRED